ncbi:MAG: DinB family protein [Anaerolineales bacterium]
MDLLDRLLGHDVWSTRQLMLQARPLTDAQLDQSFDIDSRTLRECFSHIVGNMEGWNDLLYERAVPGDQPGPRSQTLDGLLARLEAAGAEFAALARDIGRDSRWDDTFMDVLDNPPRPKTFGGAIAHVITHSMHHRAQAMFMLEQLGIKEHIEGDALTWEYQGRD